MSDLPPPSAPGEPNRSRPHLPATYGIATGNEGMLPWSYVREQMAKSRNFWVATTRPDGRPHVTPVWGLWLDESFFFSSDPTSRKGRNLAASP
ncbi:MAG: pyridoxamine 5'-phosphate oxidase family protein, partial [Chloroflexi bacterium]|nr:pyridoxamine 5'-phosphate oxidase family protein [Chloroflexota bacterium]